MRELTDRQVIRHDLNSGAEKRIDNGNTAFTSPILVDGLAVWTVSDGDALQVFLHDGATTRQHSNNVSGARDPATDGIRGVWKEFASGMQRLVLFDGNSVDPITPLDDCSKQNASVSRERVIWRQHDGQDGEIYSYDGGGVTQLTDNDVQDFDPLLDHNLLATLAEDGIASNNRDVTLRHLIEAHVVSYSVGETLTDVNFGQGMPGARNPAPLLDDKAAPALTSISEDSVDPDGDEDPYRFTVTGSVATTPPDPVVLIIDNGDEGFSTQGTWTRWLGQGLEGDIHESGPGTGSGAASWTFLCVPAGEYELAATWSAFGNRAPNSPFEVYDGDKLPGGERLNQRIAPEDFADKDANWQRLEGAFTIDSGKLVVKLHNLANGNLNADAVRIERVS